ncbi:fasciclin domain-containing protein [Pigmentiphaga sp. H8]|uniref:fasciclin domain-containing protein n=1 Tax=unclassified Pigmentiphaga TaxID=2626614 RepID=UPI000F599CAF|nr:fasciclin domain-containing protein [Pigmentiphaga sp. H8]AZG11398.1 fasciclin domain-containing protein [Pigmentiphaga sp. H8]
MHVRYILGSIATALALGLMSPAGVQARNIIDTAQTAGMFSSWVNAVREAGMEQTLKGQPYTVFAPSDEAFAKLPSAQREALRNKDTLVQVVKLHMVAGKVSLKDAKEGTQIRTEGGKTLTVHRKNRRLLLSDAEVLEPDVEVDNGYINVLDTVLFP